LEPEALGIDNCKGADTKFVMVELEDASGKDAARALGIPLATVWTRLHHARRELRQYLAEEGS